MLYFVDSLLQKYNTSQFTLILFETYKTNIIQFLNNPNRYSEKNINTLMLNSQYMRI